MREILGPMLRRGAFLERRQRRQRRGRGAMAGQAATGALRACSAMAALLLAAVMGCRGPGAGDSTPTPGLVIESPPALMRTARGLDGLPAAQFAGVVRLLGLTNPGPAIRVWLAPEGSPPARAVPDWVAGYASGAQGGWVVLLPARSPSYPNDSLAGVLRHEVAHVLTYRAAAGRPLPRWFEEGVAMVAGGDWGLNDRTRLALANLSSGPFPLADLDRRFAGNPAEVSLAYAVAGGFVHRLLATYGRDAVARVLDEVGRGLPFEPAFEKALGVPLEQAEAAFWVEQSDQGWLPLLTSPAAIWTAVTLLALLAILLRRRRDLARRALWAAEEAAAEQEPAAAVPPTGSSPTRRR